MNVYVFETLNEQAQGLQHLDAIDPDTLYVFPSVSEGMEFHSMNVPEPFDIAFLTDKYFVLALVRMKPTFDRVKVPPGCAMAVEARAGNLPRWGFVPGNTMSPLVDEESS
jgi:uncharacterized membrane protein (UPF0127 family)